MSYEKLDNEDDFDLSFDDCYPPSSEVAKQIWEKKQMIITLFERSLPLTFLLMFRTFNFCDEYWEFEIDWFNIDLSIFEKSDRQCILFYNKEFMITALIKYDNENEKLRIKIIDIDDFYKIEESKNIWVKLISEDSIYIHWFNYLLYDKLDYVMSAYMEYNKWETLWNFLVEEMSDSKICLVSPTLYEEIDNVRIWMCIVLEKWNGLQISIIWCLKRVTVIETSLSVKIYRYEYEIVHFLSSNKSSMKEIVKYFRDYYSKMLNISRKSKIRGGIIKQ